MINILLTGVGGQGTVLAAKILAAAASSHGWKVRTAETIGMSQRGGSVVSHVRIGDASEEVHAPLITRGTADLIVAFEPAEGARVLPYLAKDGVMVSATTPVRPPSEALTGQSYSSDEIIEGIESAFQELAHGSGEEDGVVVASPTLITVDDKEITDALGGNRRILNTVLLAAAIGQGSTPVTIDDLRRAISECVKPGYLDINLEAIDATLERMH